MILKKNHGHTGESLGQGKLFTQVKEKAFTGVEIRIWCGVLNN
jgi:hypothetical protein